MLTPEERAEKIIKNWNLEHYPMIDHVVSSIAAEIKAAVEDAKRDKQEFYDQGIKEAYLEGKADGLKEAASL